MIVHILMKTNDCVDRASEHLEKEERKEFRVLCEKWFEFGEYVTLSVDTEKKTIKVRER